MRRALIGLTAGATLAAGCATQHNQIRYVDMDSGSHRTSTGTFHPTGSWDLQYSWNCKRQHSEGLRDLDTMDLEVFNADDDSTSFETPEVHGRGVSGKATVGYKRAGWYNITINTRCDWRVTVLNTSKT